MKNIFIAALITATCDLAHAQVGNFTTGNDLYEQAQNTDFSSRGSVRGYVVGVHDPNRGVGRFCVPGEVTKGQMTDVAVKWLADNPQERATATPTCSSPLR